MSDSRNEQLKAELARREALKVEQVKRQNDDNGFNPKEGLAELLGGEQGLRNPLNIVRDIGVGLGRTGQKVGNYFVENLEKKDPLFKKLRSMIPESVRHEDIDFEKEYGPKNPTIPDKMLQAASGYAPFGMAGGLSIPGQIAAGGAYGYTQTDPEEKNLFGILPNGRSGGGLEGMLMAALGGGGAKAVTKIPAAYRYLTPGKDTKAFVRSLSGGDSSSENLMNIGRLLHKNASSEQAEALKPKNELLSEFGGANVKSLEEPQQPNINRIAQLFTKDAEEHTPENLSSLESLVKKAYKHGDMERLAQEGNQIFGNPEHDEKLLDQLDEHLPVGKFTEGQYGKIKDVDSHYRPEGLQTYHDAYIEKPTLRNADKLQSKIEAEIRPLQERYNNKTLDTQGENKLMDLKRNRKAIIKDIKSKIKTLPEAYQDLYQNFRGKYAEFAQKYYKNGKSLRLLAEGKPGGIKENFISGKLSGNLSPSMQKVVEDLGQEGKGNILANELLKAEPGNAISLGRKLEEAKRLKGLGQFVQPEHEKAVKSLVRRKQIQRALLIAPGIKDAIKYMLKD